MAQKIQRDYGLSYEAESEVLITSGATGGFAAALMALCQPGDEIILFEPFYSYHLNTVLALGLTPVLVPLSPPDWRIGKSELEAAITDRTRGIVVCSPSNPSGKVVTALEQERCSPSCARAKT